MTTTIYGIKNCDTMKRAFAALDAAGVAYAFHDYKRASVDEDRLRHWVAAFGWEKLLNRAGTTFRKLPDDQKQGIDADRAVALMIANPSMIKRPVLDRDGMVTVGFDPDAYARAVG